MCTSAFAVPMLCLSQLAFIDAVEFLGRAAIPADAVDQSGLTDILPGDCPHNRLGGLGSGIAYTGKGNQYLLLPDRGPVDGGATFRCRMQAFDIAVDPSAAAAERVKFELTRTIMLTTEDGRPLVGDQAAVGAGNGDAMHALRFDCEGIAVAADGTVYVSDEYGPCVDHFTADGRRIARMLAPAKFVNPVSNADPNQELPPHSMSGRQNNRGLEGLTLLPGGKTLVGVMQSPLIQDGGLDEKNKRAGYNIRMVEMPVSGSSGDHLGGPSREFVYRLETGADGVSDILAINDHEFLVLERDSTSGADAKFRFIFKMDIAGATDVSGIDSLPQGELPASITPVRKRLLLDFMDPRFDLAGSDGSGMPEKIEGMTFGPDLPDGRRLLMVTSDNDFSATNPTWIWAFALALD